MNKIETTTGTLANFYGVVIPEGMDADDAITLVRGEDETVQEGWHVIDDYLGDDWAPRDDAQAAEIAALYSESAQEVDFEAIEAADMAKPKYGSYIGDLEESVAARDWEQVEKDLAALRRHHARVIAAR